jgi:two-component system, NtrC family, sensor kinase
MVDRLLAVDDSVEYLDVLSARLELEGYEVLVARSGEEAIAKLHTQSIDCVLLDLMMPGLSGSETCQRIKALPELREIPLIVLTAHDDRSSMIDAIDAGADDYVPKLADFDVLRARLRSQLRRKHFERENRQFREELSKKELEAAETRAAHQLTETREALVEELQRKNKELEAFSFSVSHDLRAPLRGIDGFSQALQEEYGDVLDATGKDYLSRVRAAAGRMAELIDDMLELSRISRGDLRRARFDLSAEARLVTEELAKANPGRQVEVTIPEGIFVDADRRLARIVLENLFGNAWKFTSKVAFAKVELSVVELSNERAFCVRDNGAGFNMSHADKLFRPFQRLHSGTDFAGTGIGLATVQRVVDRHGGRVWAESSVGNGAAVFFTLERKKAAQSS